MIPPSESNTQSVPASSLKRQLEMTRFERAREVIESLADHRALLTTAELARINDILVGRREAAVPTEDCWRQDPLTITLPSGKTTSYSLLADPKLNTREKLHRATEAAEAGHALDAGIQIYIDLVLLHAFKDANRRTAVLAAHYFFCRYGVPVSGLALHEIGLGDLRDPEQLQALRDTVKQMAKFAQKRNQ